MVVAVLGPLEVGGDGTGLGPRERVVLAALVVNQGDVLTAEVLADALWEHPPESWRKIVQGCIVRLRKLLGAEAVETRGTGYRLTLPNEQIDAFRFERLLSRARELLALGDPDRAAYAASESLDLWRGRALSDLDDWQPGRIEADRLEELRLEAEELRVDASLQAGRYREVLAEAQARVASAPLRERRWALLAMALYQAGRQGDALRTLHQARQMLAMDLGIDPGPDIVALEDAILRQEPSLIAARIPDPSRICPYRGLRSYQVDDHDSFFGREGEVADCLDHLERARVLAVLGPSGSGKSSMVRAGVCAALERQGDSVVVVTPGSHPMDVVAGLPSSKTDFVLVVDQCEEAVMVCRDAARRAEFFDFLVEHSARSRLIVVLRADHLGELSTYRHMAELVERGLYLLKPMSEDNLRTAIEAPAMQSGLLLEHGLVDLLVREVEGEPGYLPLLSHALREIWERREANALTVAGYNASGGIRGAVAQTAERIYEEATPGQRPLLRDLMLRLVASSPDGEPVRARVPRRLVAADAKHEALVERLVEARLVTRDEDAVELAHEALARAWPRLRTWLDDDLEGQRIWRHLAVAAESWDTMGRPDSELYRGTRLAQALEWRLSLTLDLTSLEQEFLDASEHLSKAEERAVDEQMRRQISVNRRLRVLALGVALLAVIAVVAGLTARGQAVRADSEATAARSSELAASAISVMTDDPSLAKLLALTAVAEADVPTVDAMSALHEALAADLVVSRYGATFDVGLVWADLHPSGDRFVLSGTGPSVGESAAGQVVEVVDALTGEVQWSLNIGEDPRDASAFVGSPRFTDDGRHLVAGTFWDPYSPLRLAVPFEAIDVPDSEILGAYIWDADNGRLVDRYDLGRCGGLVVDSSDEYLLVKTLAGSSDVMSSCRWVDGQFEVDLVNRQSRESQVLTRDAGSPLWGAAMSGDGLRVAYDDNDDIVVVDLATGREVLRTEGRGVRDLNHDGSLLLAGDEPIQVWDVSAGEVLTDFDGHRGRSLFARFDASGTIVFSTGKDGTLREWEVTTGSQLFAYPGVGNGRPSFTDDGLVMVARPDRDTVALVDTKPRGELGIVETCPGSVVAGSLTAVGESVILDMRCDGAGFITSYMVDTGHDPMTVTASHGPAIAVSPDGRQVVSVDENRELVVRDMGGGGTVSRLEGVASQLVSPRTRWSPDGTMVAGIVNGGIVVWDSSTGQVLHAEERESEGTLPVDVMFSPDSTRLVATTSAWSIRAFSTATWERIIDKEIYADGGYQLGLAGFSDDGALLIAVGAFDGNTAGALHWFDAETLDLARSKINVHEGSITAMDLSADRMLLATGASDGTVRVWDVATGDLIHDITFGESTFEGVAFLDDKRVAVASSDGNILIATIDHARLVATAQASLTRGFTLPECSRFGFDENCPTMSELGGSTIGDVDVVNGDYEIQWGVDQLAEVFQSAAAAFFDPDAELPEAVRAFSDQLAGTYAVRLSEGRFDISYEGIDEAWCTGSYSIRDERIWLNSERGSGCKEGLLFDVGFDVDTSGLQLDRADFHGAFHLGVLFATMPLVRTS